MQQSLLTEVGAYFGSIQQESRFLNDFVLGGVNDIIGRSRSDLRYPLLWLEPPTLIPSDNGAGNIMASRDLGIVVLDKVQDGETELQAYERTEQLSIDVLSHIMKHNRLRQFGFDLNKVKMEPVSTLFVNNERGWRLAFPLEAGLNLSFDETRWNN